jgi:hypothetical protein
LSEQRQIAIIWLAQRGVTLGCNAAGTKFCPDNVLNRGALAEFIMRFETNKNDKDPFYIDYSMKYFSDIKKINKNRVAAINWMKIYGFSEGCNAKATKYCPNRTVNRGSMAEFLERLLGTTSDFPSADFYKKIAPYYYIK